ncbi:MAG: hypothetical protein IT368_07700 [Candidatus Hydrogenedentes bacterium]|nr:hypothetical protein [Candidatus Hydrogenedentota bacterium]
MIQVVRHFTGREVPLLDGASLGIRFAGAWFIGALASMPVLALMLFVFGPWGILLASPLPIAIAATIIHHGYVKEIYLETRLSWLMVVLQTFIAIVFAGLLIGLVRVVRYFVP